MAEVEVYSSLRCPFCRRAKKLLSGKGVSFKEIEVDWDAALRDEMVKRSNGARTVPQIFIDGKHIGGSDELAALDRAGDLNQMLGLN